MKDDPESGFNFKLLKYLVIFYIICFGLIKYFPEEGVGYIENSTAYQENYYFKSNSSKLILGNFRVKLEKSSNKYLITFERAIIMYLIIVFMKLALKLIYYKLIKVFYLYEANAPPKLF